MVVYFWSLEHGCGIATWCRSSICATFGCCMMCVCRMIISWDGLKDFKSANICHSLGVTSLDTLCFENRTLHTFSNNYQIYQNTSKFRHKIIMPAGLPTSNQPVLHSLLWSILHSVEWHIVLLIVKLQCRCILSLVNFSCSFILNLCFCTDLGENWQGRADRLSPLSV